MSTPRTHRLLRAGSCDDAADTVSLTYDARFIRRKKLVSDSGVAFHVDLGETVSLNDGDCFALPDGKAIRVIAAHEPLLEVTGPNLPRLAWHIGNRHTPCQIGADRLLILVDHVLEGMLRGLGADICPVSEPFLPEGGAYGHGRTMGHSHGPEGHEKDHAEHGHSHAAAHSHDHAHMHSHSHAHACSHAHSGTHGHAHSHTQAHADSSVHQHTHPYARSHDPEHADEHGDEHGHLHEHRHAHGDGHSHDHPQDDAPAHSHPHRHTS